LFIDPAICASFGERRGSQDVIYPKAAIFLKIVTEIAPPRKLLFIAIDLAKQIDESPSLQILDSVTFRLREVKFVPPRRNAPNIQLMRCDIQIAAEHDILT